MVLLTLYNRETGNASIPLSRASWISSYFAVHIVCSQLLSVHSMKQQFKRGKSSYIGQAFRIHYTSTEGILILLKDSIPDVLRLPFIWVHLSFLSFMTYKTFFMTYKTFFMTYKTYFTSNLSCKIERLSRICKTPIQIQFVSSSRQHLPNS